MLFIHFNDFNSDIVVLYLSFLIYEETYIISYIITYITSYSRRNSMIALIKNQYLLKIWLSQMRNIKYLEQLLVRNSAYHIRIYIWTTWKISFSKMNKFSLGFGSGTLMIFFSFGQPVKKNLMIFWNDSTIFIPI